MEAESFVYEKYKENMRKCGGPALLLNDLSIFHHLKDMLEDLGIKLDRNIEATSDVELGGGGIHC